MFGHIGKGKTQPFGRETDYRLGVFPERNVLLVRNADAFLREAGRDPPRPDRKISRLVCAPAKIDLVAQVNNPRYTHDHSGDLIVDGVPTIAVVKDERFPLFQFAPEM